MLLLLLGREEDKKRPSVLLVWLKDRQKSVCAEKSFYYLLKEKDSAPSDCPFIALGPILFITGESHYPQFPSKKIDSAMMRVIDLLLG